MEYTTFVPKRVTALDLTLPARKRSDTAYRWLYESLRAEILQGRLRPGVRLPSTRDLAERYGLARGTIVNAFEQLKAEGYLDGTIGSGTFVSTVLPEDLLEVRSAPDAATRAPQTAKRRLSAYGRRVNAFSNYEIRESRAFRPNVPALDLFPAAIWSKLMTRRLREGSMDLFLGCGAGGYPPLRAAIADYLNASRGVRCTADRVVIVSGVQEALDVSARLLLDPGDRVCIEDPGYEGAALVFESVGAKIVSMPVDAEGMELRERRLRGARLVYATPAHQYPLGVTMSLSRRLALLEWAARSGAAIFEDDYDSEYRYSGRPVPALQGLDRNGVVIFAGTFGKVLFPSLRLGYVVLPPDLVDRFTAVKSIASRHAQLLDQAVLCDFITEGHFGRHLRRMREVYAERLSVLLENAQRHLSGALDVSPIEAGLQTIGWLDAGIDAEAAAHAAALRGVEVTPLSRFARETPGRQGLQLGFAAIDVREIRRGVRELAAALENALP